MFASRTYIHILLIAEKVYPVHGYVDDRNGFPQIVGKEGGRRRKKRGDDRSDWFPILAAAVAAASSVHVVNQHKCILPSLGKEINEDHSFLFVVKARNKMS